MKQKAKAKLYKFPAIFVLVGAALMALIIKIFRISPYNQTLTWPTVILLALIMVLYFIGTRVEKRAQSSY